MKVVATWQAVYYLATLWLDNPKPPPLALRSG